MQLDTATPLSSHTGGMRKILKLWIQFSRGFNGVSVFQDRLWIANKDLQLFRDSAGSLNLGFGAYLGTKWTYRVDVSP